VDTPENENKLHFAADYKIMTLKDKKPASPFSFLCTEISRYSYVLGLQSFDLLKINRMCYSIEECFCPFNP